MKILVTGCAGFIGSHLCEYLLKRGDTILGIDNINDYYSKSFKERNLDVLMKYDNFEFRNEDICETKSISEWKPKRICHLASMAGVRYSIQNPKIYVKVNIEGFIHLLEEAKENNVESVVYASSSSVYGLNSKVPFEEGDTTTSCNSPYAASKMSMELFAKTYSQLYNLSTIGLRFFTVYGPRGRPDMIPYKFLHSMINYKKFQKYGNGNSTRDYTYIDDIVNGIVLSLDLVEKKSDVYNLGNSNPVSLNKFISTCERVSNRRAIYDVLEDQLGDVPHTYASIDKARKELNYNPGVSLEDGLTRTYEWLLLENSSN